MIALMAEPVETAHVARLALRIVGGWAPPTKLSSVHGQPVTQFFWGDSDMSSNVVGITCEGSELEVRRGAAEDLKTFAEEGRDSGKNFRGRLVNGWTFLAQHGVSARTNSIGGRYWMAQASTAHPVVWIAELCGILRLGEPDVPKNFVISRRGSDTDGPLLVSGHHFEGAYPYFLVPQGSEDGAPVRWFLIVDSSERPLSRKPLFDDILAMQFVLGTAFYFDTIDGLDDSGQCIAREGGRYGRDQYNRPKTEQVVPFSFCEEHWPSAFFRTISQTCRAHPELRLHIALSFLLDGLASFHVEGRYLVLHVGLEAFAYWLLESNAKDELEPRIVQKVRWRAWLKERAQEIRELAVPGQADLLLSKIESVPKRRASSRVVEAAFDRVGLQLLPEMEQELGDGRNVSVHMAVMFEERQDAVQAYTDRIAIVRAMLIALVARVVGYQGAIVGWTRKPQRRYDEPAESWWPVDPSARTEATRVHVVEVETLSQPAS